MRRLVVVTMLVSMVSVTGLALAHEGHEHKVMGKVVAIDEKSIRVLGLDGKEVEGVLTPETKYVRDKKAVARADVKVGQRVVIVVEQEKDVQKVKQVLLAATAPEDHDGAKHKH